MKVALVNTRIEPRQHVPMGLLYLAAAIEDICEVKVFDPEPDEHSGKVCDLDDIFLFQPDIIGITSMTQNWDHAKHLILRLYGYNTSETGRQTKIVVGGIHATVCTEEVRNTPGVDAVCVGEGEGWLRKYILDAPYNIEVVPLNHIDWTTLTPAYHLMPHINNYLQPMGTRGGITKKCRVDIITSRGCFANCIYCGSKAIHGKRIRRRTVVSVVKEMETRQFQYGNITFLFGDDTFTSSKKWVLDFCKTVKSMNIEWCCQTRGDRITEEVVRVMKEAGCKHIDIGVESGSDRILKILKKGITRQQYIETFKILHLYKINTGTTFVLGTPSETEWDIEQTKSLLRIIKPNFTTFFYLTPFPGTELYNMRPIDDYSGLGVQHTPVLDNPTISKERYIEIRNELNKIISWWNIRNYLRPSVLWWFLSNVTSKNLVKLVKTSYKCTIYDAMYEFLQNVRRMK